MDLKNPGLVPDPRTELAKAKDYVHEEVSGAVPLFWNRGIEGAPIYSLRDQDGSSSCVAQAIAKALEVNTGVVQSAHPIYRRRGNFADEGMWLQNGGEIIKNVGTTTELLDPSQKLSEDKMNADVTVQTPLKGYTYVTVNVKNIDQIAEAIETRKQCIITFGGTFNEYAYSEKPVANLNDTNINCRHAICGVYYFTDTNGEKCILIDESWGPNNIRRRVLTESYLKARGTGAMYLIPPAAPQPPQKPHFNFTSTLKFGQTNYSIKVLQDTLKYEGLFPQNVTSTGYYGPITAKFVLMWQKIHNVALPHELDALQGKSFGPKSIKVANGMYN